MIYDIKGMELPTLLKDPESLYSEDDVRFEKGKFINNPRLRTGLSAKEEKQR